MSVAIEGWVEPGCERIADAFRNNFAKRDEVGASVAVWCGDRQIADLWAGIADPDTGRAWERDTLAVTFSVTKGLVAVIVRQLVEEGLLDDDAPVARYWPGFAQNGKQDITVRQLLQHRAGLPALDTPLDVLDFGDPESVRPALEAQAPHWPPGSRQAYHATTWGMYVGELVRQITGETVGTRVRRYAASVGADVHLGNLDEAEQARVAHMLAVKPAQIVRQVFPQMVRGKTTESWFFRRLLLDTGSLPRRALSNPELGPERTGRVNDPAVRDVELPWMGAVASANGLMNYYRPLATGDGPFSAATIQACMARGSWSQRDPVLGKPIGFTLGFVKERPGVFGPNRQAFGHPGAGGCVGWADPKAQVAIGYTMNRMSHRIRSPRSKDLAKAVYEVL